MQLTLVEGDTRRTRRPGSPLVSIVVPVYNGEATLRESLSSILAQTYPNTEVLVMDDASTDATYSVIAEFGDRVQSIRQLANRGNYPNVNDGVARASGEYVAVYHADDIYEPRIVEREVAYLEAYPDVGAVFASDIFIDADGRELGRLLLPPELRGGLPLDYATVLNALLMYKNRFLRCPSSMVRRSVYLELGYYRHEECGIASDLDMWLRIASRYQLGIIDDHLFRYRRGHGSWSDRFYTLRTEPERYFAILDRHLATSGRAVARPNARAAFEAHRAEDQLMCAVAHYILDQRKDAKALLDQIKPRRLLASGQVERDRLLGLLLLLQILIRLPHIPAVAARFRRRWHNRTNP